MDIPGTDYWPVADGPTGAEAEPDLYRIFSYAVLAQHRRMRVDTVDKCTCGSSWERCEVNSLARQLLVGVLVGAD